MLVLPHLPMRTAEAAWLCAEVEGGPGKPPAARLRREEPDDAEAYPGQALQQLTHVELTSIARWARRVNINSSGELPRRAQVRELGR